MTLARRTHACALYRTDEEHWEITGDFLAAGLLRGEQVVCVDDEGTADAVLRRLGENGLDVAPYRSRGQLLIEPVDLPTRSAGPTAAQVAAAVDARVGDCLADGYPGLRLAFETGALLRSTADVEWLLEMDAACAPIWATAPVVALCQVDQRLTTAAQRAEIRDRHELEVDAPAAHDDGSLRITCDAGHRRWAGEVDLSNRDAPLSDLRAALCHGDADVRLDVASLRFVDAGTIGVLAHTAARLPTGRRIVLERPGAVLRRLLSVCDLDRLPGLVVEPPLPTGVR